MIDLQFDSKICEKNAAATRTAFKAYGEDPSDLRTLLLALLKVKMTLKVATFILATYDPVNVSYFYHPVYQYLH